MHQVTASSRLGQKRRQVAALQIELTTEEVLRLLGEPANISERIEDDLVVTTYEFPRGAERVLVAQFV
ncbi:MAG: hypothetical protein M3R69_17040, partial [Acidobacteriota bacterium]|nr:hypothetical protein [Acidobacteriota bacterium]